MNENKSSSKDQRQGPSWGIVIVIFFLLTFFLNLFNSWNETFTIVLASILVIGLLIDTIISFKMMNTFKNLCKNIEQKQIIPRDDTERIKKLVKKQIQTSKMRLEKRIMDAFPHLKIQTWNKTKKKKTKKESCQR